MPLGQWPTGKLVWVGLVIAVTAGFGLFVMLRAAWKAWDQGETLVLVGALAVSGFLGVWVVILGQFILVLLRRWSHRRHAGARGVQDAAQQKTGASEAGRQARTKLS